MLCLDDIDDQFHCIPSASSKEGNNHEICEEIDREEPSSGEGKARGGDDARRQLTVNNVNPYVEESTGAWLLNEYDVDCIATGAGILSCGGGGNPYLGKLTAILTLQSGKEIRVIHPDRYVKCLYNM